MARRYSRDNRGRFSSGGGATARGGRLRTASGKKRATVTAKAKGPTMAGAVKGKVKRDPGAMAKVGKKTASAGSMNTAKAERIVARLDANVKRSAARKGETGKKALKRARSSAVARLAMVEISQRAVGKNDPTRQYPRRQLMEGLQKTLSKPLPKNKRRSAGKRGKDDTRQTRDAVTSTIFRNRMKQR